MAKALAIPDLHADTRFAEAAAAAVELRSRELFDHVDGVLDMDDIERVHDMRVASRRLRAVLELFAPCFPKRRHRAVLRDVKQLADALGARRDPDVAVASLKGIAAGLTDKDRPGLNGLIAQIESERRDGNGELADALEAVEESELHDRLLDLAARARRA